MQTTQMYYFLAMFALLLIGTVVLVGGLLLGREPGQTVKSAFVDSLGWGLGFLVFFGIEFYLLGNS